MAIVKVQVLIRGVVQGVGFRVAAQKMLEWCREGPPLANVSQVEVVTRP